MFGFELPCTFVVAHPGHELRAHHGVERLRPRVSVLTDGSGSTGRSRLHETTALLAALGGRPGRVYGHLSDRDAYLALMDANPAPFAHAMSLVVDDLVEHGCRTVVTDAVEGFNPVHDVCGWIARGAVAIVAARNAGQDIALYEIDLVAHPDGDGDGVRVTLDADAFRRKLDSARAYAALAAEASTAFERYGEEAFRTEFFRKVVAAPPPGPDWVPTYEQVGEARVAAGRYTSVLRFGEHVRPVISALSDMAGLPA